ncbi:cytochrome C oxidase subunit II [Solemya elarraichensis gill symbiont]|uniref:Cytochrome C oxidase subunit II n=1 Tax=Solemya elarraichensis gill symbiont TaxID=1918949 RepID=A0A1T2LCE0_9GAMM|nr:cytochrome C oxidase subunit II [Solemya elarraichensis gill symbiont]OOZ42682.1 cytochrome C oxidase subunit II [Solemya elarraichensis gill symbiont]
MQDPLKAICDDPLERRWVWISLFLAVVFGVILGFYALGNNLHPPSNVEPIDSATLHLSGEFAEDNLGVKENGDGTLTVTMVAARYGFFPPVIEVPTDTPVKFRMASADVLHGVHVPYTNAATMIVPGYVSEFTTSFPKAGKYSFLCNEYCGLGHDSMWSRLNVVEKSAGGVN